MTVIDVHTHMLNEAWVSLLADRSGTYTIGEPVGGGRSVHRAGASFMTLTPAMFDYDLRIADMDAAGVDLAVVSLTCPNVYWGDEGTSVSAARLVNDDMADAQRRYPDRIRFLASLPWQYPQAALAELERAHGRGAVGVMVLANVEGVPLVDPRFAPIWSAIETHDLPVLLHPTVPPGVDAMDLGRYNLIPTVGFTFDTTLALSRMILDGFFDRYPRLTVIGGHAGGYLPFLIGRLDSWHRAYPSVRETISELPSTYLERIHADAIVYRSNALRLTVDELSPDNVLYGSDYPHKNGHMSEILQVVDTLSPSERERVRGRNAQRIFKI